MNLEKYKKALEAYRPILLKGYVQRITGLTIEASGPLVKIGEICEIHPATGAPCILSEVVGFKEERILLMPLGDMEGIGPGSMVVATGRALTVSVGPHMVGRILDGLGNPIDGKGPLQIKAHYPVNNTPPNPLTRKRIQEILPLGVRAIDGLLTCGKGQRIGIFAGSGVGKSTLMGMIARNALSDINIIGLIGERGREVREFIENDLQEEGLSRSVVVVATSDQPALVRLKGALLATAIGEYFRDQGKDVMLLMDSLTRFSMAQREVGLAIGEPPVTRGYTPSVFAILPKLLERSGTSEVGSITALYTVLVDGDDMNEPITDAARGILDGHIVLSRKLAHKNHYPAIDVLASISRVMPNIASLEHKKMASAMKDLMATYRDSEDLINIGAYKEGSNPGIDKAIQKIDRINAFLNQDVFEHIDMDAVLQAMEEILAS